MQRVWDMFGHRCNYIVVKNEHRTTPFIKKAYRVILILYINTDRCSDQLVTLEESASVSIHEYGLRCLLFCVPMSKLCSCIFFFQQCA